jgi:hypothetical protein
MMLYSFLMTENDLDRVCNHTPDLDSHVYTVQPSLIDNRLVVLVECDTPLAIWIQLQIST